MEAKLMVGAKVPRKVYEAINNLAHQERRSRSQMIALLLEDALKHRRQQTQGGTQ